MGGASRDAPRSSGSLTRPFKHGGLCVGDRPSVFRLTTYDHSDFEPGLKKDTDFVSLHPVDFQAGEDIGEPFFPGTKFLRIIDRRHHHHPLPAPKGEDNRHSPDTRVVGHDFSSTEASPQRNSTAAT